MFDSHKELGGNGSNPSLVGSFISISPPKKCPFLPSCVCPAPVRGVWSAGCHRCLHRQEMSPAGQDPCQDQELCPQAGTGVLITFQTTGGPSCSILEGERSSLHLSPDRNHLSRQKSPLQTEITSPDTNHLSCFIAPGLPRDCPGLTPIHFGS